MLDSSMTHSMTKQDPILESPTVGVLLIGNELLSGQVADINLPYMATQLEKQGVQILETRIVPDQEAAIIQAVHALAATYTYVVTTGGIGPTHDDITIAAIAKAFDRPLVLHPGAVACFGTIDSLTPAQRQMACLPEGATLVVDPATNSPGFRVKNVFSIAGFPHIMQGMFGEVLKEIGWGAPLFTLKASFLGPESHIAAMLQTLQLAYPTVAIGSYPHYTKGHPPSVTLVFKGREQATVQAAHDRFKAQIA